MADWVLTGDEVRRAVFLGTECAPGVATALHVAGVATTRDPAGASVAITAHAEQVPATARWVHSPFMGVDALLPGLPESVVVTRTTLGMPGRIGSYVATSVLAERWGLPSFLRQQAAGVWRAVAVPREPERRQALVVGAGLVGSGCARALRPLYDRVVGVNASGQVRGEPVFDAVVPWDQADGVWAASDVVVVALPLTEGTRGLFDAVALSRLVDAHLILVGRGATVDFGALQAAMAAGQVRYASIDVLPQEPPPANSWLWSSDRVTLTPHIAGLTHPDDIVTSFLSARQALVEGRTPLELVRRGQGY